MTNTWVIVFLVIVPAMAGLMVVFTWLSHISVQYSIGRKHRALEQIHLTSRIPSFWTEKYDRKLLSLERYGPDAPKAAEWRRRRRSRVLSELERLTEYTRRTRLVAEEDVRSVLLDDLEALRREWQETAPAAGPVRRGFPGNAEWSREG
ncbi:hypothetical protein [Paenibacillus ginsengarvi]|uniref:Uncharacterized protein n=1 Tax=Paenibacillus ginsengarvi TaxID=400777 RepID=A0A3B0ANP7_9BACL|nr:hypothetical protein [Paenibacillus ginsengarvi]RKN60786.1 hypothetical protein D7M11_35770 [Paenibacillus ginsengarvi]